MNLRFLLSMGLAATAFLPLAAFADVQQGISFPDSAHVSISMQTTAGNRGTGSYCLYKGTYPDTSTPDAGSCPSGNWGAAGVNVWTFNFSCTIENSTQVTCPLGSGGGWLADPPAGGAGSYWLSMTDTNYTGGATDVYYPMSYNGTVWEGVPSDTTTHISTVTPAPLSTVATSSAASFGASGYINPADYVSGMYIEIKYAAYSSYQASVANPSSLFTTLDLPITSSGSFIVSTTSPLTTKGQYTMQTQLRTRSLINSVINFFGFNQFATLGIKSSTSTTFVAAELSGYDRYVASTTGAINSYLASSTISMASCSSWTEFSLGDCLNLLFVPQTQPIVDALAGFRDGFLSYFPFGYVTRAVVILSSTATTTVPSIHVQIPLGRPGSPEYTDGYFTLNVQDMLDGGALYADSIRTSFGDDKTFKEVAQPFIDITFAMFLIVYIINDLLKMRHHSAHGGGKLH